MRRTTNQNFRGFTLVELLVVVAIIAVLISILLPALNRARESAKAVVCMSRVNQTYMMVQAYAVEYLGIVPQGKATSAPNDFWFKQYTQPDLKPIVNRDYYCPNVLKNTSTYAMYTPRGGNPLAGEFSSHGVNGLTFHGLRLALLPKPANYTLLIDSAQSGVPGGGVPPLSFPVRGGRDFHGWIVANNGGQFDDVWLAHQDRANAMFVDGHAEACDTLRLREVVNWNKTAPGKHGIDSYWTTDGIHVDVF